MTVGNKEYEAIKRIRELLILQNELKSAFPENEYNVFVFGSYPTVRFSKDKSDVDIAVYADSLEMYKKMSVIIENFFEEKNMEGMAGMSRSSREVGNRHSEGV